MELMPLAVALFTKPQLAWLPAGTLAALYVLGLYRGWAMQGLAAVFTGIKGKLVVPT